MTLPGQTEISVKDGNNYIFTTAFVNVENPLGVVKASLKEYTICKTAGQTFIGKLYRTKDGDWYDMPGNKPIGVLLRTMIMTAIEEQEKKDEIVSAGYQD